jgi:formate/nitrite transporter FocA (FNT family)
VFFSLTQLLCQLDKSRGLNSYLIFIIVIHGDWTIYLFADSICFGIFSIYVGRIKKRSGSQSFVIGYLFSFIGTIIVALLPPQQDKSATKECPYCKESIKQDAIKCPYCQSNLPEMQ